MEERDPTRELWGSQHQEPAKETEGAASGLGEVRVGVSPTAVRRVLQEERGSRSDSASLRAENPAETRTVWGVLRGGTPGGDGRGEMEAHSTDNRRGSCCEGRQRIGVGAVRGREGVYSPAGDTTAWVPLGNDLPREKLREGGGMEDGPQKGRGWVQCPPGRLGPY